MLIIEKLRGVFKSLYVCISFYCTDFFQPLKTATEQIIKAAVLTNV